MVDSVSNAVTPLADGAISAGLTGVQDVVSYLFTEFGNLVTTIASQPLLLLPVGVFVCGAIIGLAKRLIGR
jgi:hypothetical protein